MVILSIIPGDIELVIPGNIAFFEWLIVISFLLHIIFVNITVGSSALAVFQELRGIRRRSQLHDQLASQLAHHTSVLKSIAVVLGVAPLLLISVIYTQYFYPSTILIGKAWLSLLLILILAFLLLYLYKFTWNKWTHVHYKRIHVLIGASGSLLLLFVPLIFIVNVVSMLYPEMWAESKGFFHALTYYPQIWQRYFHFILASFALAGFYIYFWNQRLSLRENTSGSSKDDLHELGKRLGLNVLILSTALQFVTGFWLLMQFEPEIRLLYIGEDLLLTGLLVVSLILTIGLLALLFLLMKYHTKRYFILSAATFILVLAAMGWMRHELRESYLDPYKAENPRTVELEEEIKVAQ